MFINRDKVTSTWGQLRQFFYKSWLFGSRGVKFGSIGYTFGGTNIKEEQKFSDRDKITTNWQ